MKKVAWSETLSVGISEIDGQHKQLITILNDLLDAKHNKNDFETISALISKMADYIDYHFGTEESYMNRFHFPGLIEHRNEHRLFIRKVFELRRDFSSNKETLSDDMLDFLKNWLQHHIMETDRAYIPCFQEHGL
jgi:hemerythrin